MEIIEFLFYIFRKVKVTSLRPPRKPELEKIRDEVLAESKNINHDEIFNQLKDQVRNIHAAYLFTPNGVEVLADLCKVISSTPTSLYYSSWKNLAGVLNLSFHQIGVSSSHLMCLHFELCLDIVHYFNSYSI